MVADGHTSLLYVWERSDHKTVSGVEILDVSPVSPRKWSWKSGSPLETPHGSMHKCSLNTEEEPVRIT